MSSFGVHCGNFVVVGQRNRSDTPAICINDIGLKFTLRKRLSVYALNFVLGTCPAVAVGVARFSVWAHINCGEYVGT